MRQTGGIFLVVLGSFCIMLIQAEEAFHTSPGDLRVLEKTPLTLFWNHSLPQSLIEWCYYQHIVYGSPVEEFLGWDNNERRRLNMSLHHKGWEFLNQETPCLGGIRRETTDQMKTGEYVYHIYGTNGRDYTSPKTVVSVYSASDLVYELKVDDIVKMSSAAENPVFRPLRLDPHHSGEVTLSLHESCPPSNITIKLISETKTEEVVAVCRDKKSCHNKFQVDPSIVQLAAEIDAGISGFKPIITLLPILTATENKKGAVTGLAIILVLVLLAVVGIGLYYWFVLRKRPNFFRKNKSNTDAKITIVPVPEKETTKIQIKEEQRADDSLIPESSEFDEVKDERDRLVINNKNLENRILHLQSDNQQKDTEIEEMKKDILKFQRTIEEEEENYNTKVQDYENQLKEKDIEIARLMRKLDKRIIKKPSFMKSKEEKKGKQKEEDIE